MPPPRFNPDRRLTLKLAIACGCVSSPLAQLRASTEMTQSLALGCTLESGSFALESGEIQLVEPADALAINAPENEQISGAAFSLNGQTRSIVASSGDRQFDRALAESLNFISDLFGVTPTFGFIENADKPNAYATTRRYKPEANNEALLKRSDGTVLVADSVLAWMKSKGIDDPVAAMIAICAHEFGHIAQFKFEHHNRKISTILRHGVSNVRRLELHADFLSGYYLGVAKHRNPDTPAATVAYATSLIGDEQVSSFNHHGSPEERGQSVVAGFQLGYDQRASFKDALVLGLKYVGAIS